MPESLSLGVMLPCEEPLNPLSILPCGERSLREKSSCLARKSERMRLTPRKPRTSNAPPPRYLLTASESRRKWVFSFADDAIQNPLRRPSIEGVCYYPSFWPRQHKWRAPLYFGFFRKWGRSTPDFRNTRSFLAPRPTTHPASSRRRSPALPPI